MANNTNGARGVVSRSGSAYPNSQHGGGRANPSSSSRVSCNRCRKPLATTVFVCSCDCVFCEECTYSHFNDSSSCPVCQVTLGASDFMELVVADPSSATEETLKNTFQTIFTKFSSSSNALSHQEMCTRLLKSFDDDRRAVRFMLKQFVLEGKTAGQLSGNIGRAYEQLKKEHTHLKQATSSQRIQTEQTIADLQHRVQALTGTVQEQQKKIDEKDIQINQFRQLYAADGMARVPSSSHSNHSSGGRRGGGPQPGSHGRSSDAGQQPHPTPPMQGFVMQKQARERAKEQALGEMTRSRGPPIAPGGIGGGGGGRHHGGGLGGGPSLDVDSVITPIQVPPPHHHRHNTLNSPHQGNGVVLPKSSRIRDLSAGSGYVFTSHSSHRDNAINKRQRLDTSSSSSSISPGQQQQGSFGFARGGPQFGGGFGRR